MEKDREHPLYYLSVEDTIIATFVWLDDELKDLAQKGLRLPRQKGQKASYSELLTIDLMITFLGMDTFKGYLIFTQGYRYLFPKTPHFSRFTRIIRNAHRLVAQLAMSLGDAKDSCFVVDLKPVPVAHGQHIHSQAMAEAEVGKGPLGGFAGFKLAAVMDSRALFTSWALLPGNAHENDAEALVKGLPNCLGDKGFRWLEGVLTPPYRLRGGKRVETGWQPWMYLVRNWIETRFSVMVRSFRLHRLEAKQYWTLVSRVNLMILASNLVHSHVLLKLAGVSIGGSITKGSRFYTSPTSQAQTRPTTCLSRPSLY
jgi:hypothetical protein